MALALKYLLKDRRLRSGAKSLLVGGSLLFVPPWVVAALALVFYLFPAAFAGEFLGTFLSAGYAVYSVLRHGPVWAAPLLSSVLLFLILGIKNVHIPHRATAFAAVSSAVFFIVALGVFGRFVPIFAFAIVVFLLLKEGLKAFTVLPQRAVPSAAIISLVLSEIAWVINWLGASAFFSAVLELVFAFAAVYLVYHHLRGDIANRRAVFIGLAATVAGLAGMLLAAFK